MPQDPNATRTQQTVPPTAAYDTALDAGLAAAFGPDATPGGWSQPPLLRDDPSEHAPLVQPSSAEMPRGTDDRYQLLGEIARGGMGVVLKGRDPDLGRDLAFKVLRQELSGKPAAVQRFVEEAQVGGQLQHPGIVPVYDLGRFGDGRPYFAMKLVKGRTLADLLAERQDPSVDRGRYLRHFLQVCNTLAYAHSKGVLHRDMKPSNVMVGAFDEVLVMDWGLAKVLARGGVADEAKASRASEPAEVLTEIKTARFGSGSETAAGSVMGTPAFMPPEQAGGEIDKLDERADVFGLGAVLCVILTGKPPYVSDSGEALRLMAVRGQLDECYARLDACGADAELVGYCKRSLAVNRDARPRDAAELAATMEGYLTGVETRARAAEIERERAEVRHAEERKRRKTQLVFGGVALFVLLAGAMAASWQWWRAEGEKAKTADALAKAKEEQTRTFAALNAMTDEGVERLMTSQLEIGEEQRTFVKTVIGLYVEATKSQLDTPEGRAARAHGHYSVGKLREKIQDFAGATESHLAAGEIYKSLVQEYPGERKYRFEHSLNATLLSTLHHSLNRIPDAEREVRLARQLLQELVAEDASDPEYVYQLARAEINLGRILRSKGPVAARDAEAKVRSGIQRLELLLEKEPDSKVYARGLSMGLSNLAISLDDRPNEKEAVLRRAVAVAENLSLRHSLDPLVQQSLGFARNNLGAFLNGTKKYSESEIEYRAAKEVRQKLSQRFPVVQRYRSELSVTLLDLANTLMAQTKYREAETEMRNCAAICEGLLNDGVRDTNLRTRYVYAVRGIHGLPGSRYFENERLLRAMEFARVLIAENPGQIVVKQVLAKMHEVRGRNLPLDKRDEKIAEFQASIRILDELLAKMPQPSPLLVERGQAKNNLAMAYSESNQHETSTSLLESAIADYNVALERNPDDPFALSSVSVSHLNLVTSYGRLEGRRADALAHALKSREYLLHLVALSPTAANRARLAHTLQLLGNIYAFSFKRPDEATKALNESLEISRKLMAEIADGSVSARDYFMAATELAGVLNGQKRYHDAERLLKEVGPFAASLRAKNRDRLFLGQSALHMSMTAAIQARKGDHAAANKAIPTMLAIDADNPLAYLNATCILGHCVLAVEQDTKISDQVRKDLTAAYTEQAMDYLKEGFNRGYSKHEELAKDPDLEVFRKHPVFQRVLAEMRKAKDASPKPVVP